MRTVTVGSRRQVAIPTTVAHTASAAGNPGVHVVSTTSLILFLEMAAHELIVPAFEPGEGSVGTKVDIEHLAACKAGATVVAEAIVATVDGRRIVFDVAARAGDRLLSLEGRWTDTPSDGHRAAEKILPGKPVPAVIRRGGKEMTIEVTPRNGF